MSAPNPTSTPTSLPISSIMNTLTDHILNKDLPFIYKLVDCVWPMYSEAEQQIASAAVISGQSLDFYYGQFVAHHQSRTAIIASHGPVESHRIIFLLMCGVAVKIVSLLPPPS